jgi:hypothetical protein
MFRLAPRSVDANRELGRHRSLCLCCQARPLWTTAVHDALASLPRPSALMPLTNPHDVAVVSFWTRGAPAPDAAGISEATSGTRSQRFVNRLTGAFSEGRAAVCRRPDRN